MSQVRTSLRWVVSLSLAVIVTGLGIADARAQSPERLLVLLRDASALAIVDPESGTVLARVPTGRDPHEVTASADGRLAFVASMVDGISVIDIAAREEIRRVDPGPGSQTHDVLFAAGKVYFTIEGYKSIGRYDPSTNRIDWTLGIGQDGTHMLVLDQDRDRMFLPNTGSNSVTMVEGVMAGPARATLTDIAGTGRKARGHRPVAGRPGDLDGDPRRWGRVDHRRGEPTRCRDARPGLAGCQSPEIHAGRASADHRRRSGIPGGHGRRLPDGRRTGERGFGGYGRRRRAGGARRLACLSGAEGRGPCRGRGSEHARGHSRDADGRRRRSRLHVLDWRHVADTRIGCCST